MTDLAASLGLVFAATFAPLAVGSFLGVLFSDRIPKEVIAALGAGVLTWLFFDLTSDAAALGVSSGLEGATTAVPLVVAFVVGFGALVYADKSFMSRGPLPFYVAILASIALGLHSAGEGMDIGNGFATIGLQALLGTAAVAFIIHKVIEGLMLSAFLICGTSRPTLRNAGTMSLVASAMAVAATPLGYFALLSSAWLFALGTGADIYMLLRLLPQTLGSGGRGRLFLWFSVGFVIIYLAALLHA
jgi:hypothetical protein